MYPTGDMHGRNSYWLQIGMSIGFRIEEVWHVQKR